MKPSVSILAILASAASGAAIAPSMAAAPVTNAVAVPVHKGALYKRDTLELRFYVDINWGGDWGVANYPMDSGAQCWDLFNQYNDHTSSIWMSRTTDRIQCQFYVDSGCNGGSLGIVQSQSDLRNSGFNDVISSFKCFYF